MDDAKRDLVRAWLLKARNDLETARQISDLPDGHLDAAIYHCQQAAEKAVKGFLAFHDHRLERTHDVERLVGLAAAYEAGFATWVNVASLLTPMRPPTGTRGRRQCWSRAGRSSRTPWLPQPD
jgi:hypothetical protein